MNVLNPKFKESLIYKSTCLLVAFVFAFSMVLPPPVYAQSALNLPIPGTMVTASQPYLPAHMIGLNIYPDNPLMFDFIIDKGDTGLEGEEYNAEASKLMKYFLASMTVPEDDLWVNLSPYEQGRIIPEDFGQTEMGRDLLAQDYILKQLTATLLYPEDEVGAEFWSRVYKKANDMFGTTEIPVNTFNKVWIVPEKAVVYETGNSAYVMNTHLKVMLEEDYMSIKNNVINRELGTVELAEKDVRAISNVSSDVVREVIIPEIEKEVNEGKNFAPLRQIYNSMILAVWYKNNLKESLLGQVYADKNKTSGVDIEDREAKEKIYQQYLDAFKKGVYNYIKEDYDPYLQETVARQYISGGFVGANVLETIRAQSSTSMGDLLSAGFVSAEDIRQKERAADASRLTSFTAEVWEMQGNRAVADYSSKPDIVTAAARPADPSTVSGRDASSLTVDGVKALANDRTSLDTLRMFRPDFQRLITADEGLIARIRTDTDTRLGEIDAQDILPQAKEMIKKIATDSRDRHIANIQPRLDSHRELLGAVDSKISEIESSLGRGGSDASELTVETVNSMDNTEFNLELLMANKSVYEDLLRKDQELKAGIITDVEKDLEGLKDMPSGMREQMRTSFIKTRDTTISSVQNLIDRRTGLLDAINAKVRVIQSALGKAADASALVDRIEQLYSPGGQQVIEEKFAGFATVRAGNSRFELSADAREPLNVSFQLFLPDRAVPLSEGVVSVGKEYTVGRGGSVDFVVEFDEVMSRQHFKFKVDRDESGELVLTVTDLGSRNGTTVDWKASLPEDELRLYKNALKETQFRPVIARNYDKLRQKISYENMFLYGQTTGDGPEGSSVLVYDKDNRIVKVTSGSSSIPESQQVTVNVFEGKRIEVVDSSAKVPGEIGRAIELYNNSISRPTTDASELTPRIVDRVGRTVENRIAFLRQKNNEFTVLNAYVYLNGEYLDEIRTRTDAIDSSARLGRDIAEKIRGNLGDVEFRRESFDIFTQGNNIYINQRPRGSGSDASALTAADKGLIAQGKMDAVIEKKGLRNRFTRAADPNNAAGTLVSRMKGPFYLDSGEEITKEQALQRINRRRNETTLYTAPGANYVLISTKRYVPAAADASSLTALDRSLIAQGKFDDVVTKLGLRVETVENFQSARAAINRLSDNAVIYAKNSRGAVSEITRDQAFQELNFGSRSFAFYSLPWVNSWALIDTGAGRDASVLTGQVNEPVGGIDLNPVNLNLQIKRDPKGVPIPIDPVQIENINVDGFFPVIINVQPVTTLPLILGELDTLEKDKISKI